jgi:hypothetical protein
MKPLFLFMILLFSYGSCVPIIKNVPVCRVTNRSIDLDLPCHDTACVLYKNLIYQMSGQDDMFNYIYTADLGQTIVYSNNGRVYYTECDIIPSYDILQNQTCSKYVVVLFQYKFEQTIGYMSKQNIIRMSINHEENCEFPKTQVDFNNYNNEYKLYKKGDKVAISIRNDSINSIDFENQNAIIELYDQLFSTSLPKILREIFISIIALVLLFLGLIKAIVNRQKLFFPIERILFGFKKICCWCCRSQIIEPTMDCAKAANYPPHTIINLPPPPSAPLETSAAYRTFANHPSYVDPNLYHTIGNNRSSTDLYQQRMPTRSCSVLSIKEEPYNSVYNPEMVTCPLCPQNPPKLCKGQTGLAQHMARTHKIN